MESSIFGYEPSRQWLSHLSSLSGGIFRVSLFIVMSYKKNILIYSFLICIPFVSFFCLISLASTSTTKLNKSGKVYSLISFLIVMEIL